MTLNDVINNWDNLDGQLKLMALNRVIAEALGKMQQGDDNLIRDFILTAEVYEVDNYFGAEGLEI